MWVGQKLAVSSIFVLFINKRVLPWDLLSWEFLARFAKQPSHILL